MFTQSLCSFKKEKSITNNSITHSKVIWVQEPLTGTTIPQPYPVNHFHHPVTVYSQTKQVRAKITHLHLDVTTSLFLLFLLFLLLNFNYISTQKQFFGFLFLIKFHFNFFTDWAQHLRCLRRCHNRQIPSTSKWTKLAFSLLKV